MSAKGFSKIAVVTGGRDHKDPHQVWNALDAFGPEIVIEGGCPTGADAHAREYVKRRGLQGFTAWANWDALSRADGMKRNEAMMRLAAMLTRDPESTVMLVVLAFPTGGPGTRNAISEAQTAGLHGLIYDPETKRT